jgi:addiction module HigA family antidote
MDPDRLTMRGSLWVVEYPWTPEETCAEALHAVCADGGKVAKNFYFQHEPTGAATLRGRGTDEADALQELLESLPYNQLPRVVYGLASGLKYTVDARAPKIEAVRPFLVTADNVYAVIAALHNATLELPEGPDALTEAAVAADAEVAGQVQTGCVRLDYYRGRPLKVVLRLGEDPDLRRFEEYAGKGEGRNILDLLAAKLTPRSAGVRALHPGAYLQDTLLAPQGISPRLLAAFLEMPAKEMAAFCQGSISVSAKMAARLGAYFRTDPEFWLDLQAKYDAAGLAERAAGWTVEPQAVADALLSESCGGIFGSLILSELDRSSR